MGYPTNKEGLRGLARATYHCTVPIEEFRASLGGSAAPTVVATAPDAQTQSRRSRRSRGAWPTGGELGQRAVWERGVDDSIAFDTNMLAKPTPRRLMTL